VPVPEASAARRAPPPTIATPGPASLARAVSSRRTTSICSRATTPATCSTCSTPGTAIRPRLPAVLARKHDHTVGRHRRRSARRWRSRTSSTQAHHHGRFTRALARSPSARSKQKQPRGAKRGALSRRTTASSVHPECCSRQNAGAAQASIARPRTLPSRLQRRSLQPRPSRPLPPEGEVSGQGQCHCRPALLVVGWGPR